MFYEICTQIMSNLQTPLLELSVRNSTRYLLFATPASIRYATAIRYLLPWSKVDPCLYKYDSIPLNEKNYALLIL
jgi:hypothetical protein